jgi:hypothetical protein
MPGSEGKSVSLFILDAANAGTRPITLKGASIRLPTGSHVAFPRPFYADRSFPCELTEGTSCTLMIDWAQLADAFQRERIGGKVQLVAVFRDALGREYRSKPFPDGYPLLASRRRVLRTYGGASSHSSAKVRKLSAPRAVM